MRIVILSIALLFCAVSAHSQVLKSAGVWYFLDVDSMTARPAVLPNGTELAYVVGTKKIYYWNRTTSTWTEYSAGGGGLTMPFDSIYFTPTTADPDTAELKYNADLETFVFGADGTIIEIGQKTAWYVKNQTGSTINKGTVVRASGTLGSSGRILISPMVIDGTVASKYLLGITASNIANGSDGYVIHFGKLRKFNTSAWADGTVLYAGTGGTLTATEPSPPNLRLPIAFVVHSHATNGILAIRIQTGNELHELHDVDTTGIQNNGLLTWNSSSQKWQAAAPDNDKSSTNEIQTLSFASPLLAISSGNNVDLSPILTGYVTGSGTTNYVPKWSALTNLTNSNIFDNNTYAGVISRPWKFGEYTTAGLPTGVTGYHVYNTTTNGPGWYQGNRWAYGLESTFNRGTSTRVPFFDANGQITDNAAATINLTGVLGRMEIRGSIDQKTLVVRRTNSSQTANVFEVASEAGGTIVGINALGYIDAADLRLRNNGRTAFRGVTNFATFVDNVTSTFFQVSNSSDGNRLLFTSENGQPLARLGFLSSGAYIYNGSFGNSPAPVSEFAVINTNSAAQPMTIKLANPQNVDAFRITSNADVKLFHVESDGKVAIKNSTTAARDLDVNGEVRIRDLTTDTPTRIVGADADGDLADITWLVPLSTSSLGIGVTPTENLDVNGDGRFRDSIRIGTLPNQATATKILSADANGWVGYRDASSFAPNTIYTASDSIRGDRYLEMANDGSATTALGYFPDFPDRTYNYNEYGVYVGNGSSGEVSILNILDELALYGNGITITSKRSPTKFAADLGVNSFNHTVSLSTYRFNSDGANITLDTIGVIYNPPSSSPYRLLPDSSPSTTSAAKTVLQWTGDGSNANPAFVDIKTEPYYTVTSTSSPQTLSSTTSDNLINQGGTQATFTLTFPASPVDGQVLKITYNNAITTLTLDGNGNTIVGSAVTTGVAGSQRAFKFYTGIGWIKLY